MLAQSTVAAGPEDASPALQEIVVTAQRRSESIQNVSQTITAFSAQSLNDLGVKSTSDLSPITPNIMIAMPGGAGNQPLIVIRGIGSNDTNTNNAGPAGVYVDEIYLSSPSSQSFATFDLERVEVLKGPQGTLYGRNSSAGAINFISAKPTDTPEADFHAEYSSFNTVNLEGAAGGPLASGLDGRAAFVVNESDGYFHNTYTGTSENGANNYALRFALQWKPLDALKLLFNVHGGQVDNRPTEYRHIGDFVPGTQSAQVPTQCSASAANAGECVDIYGVGTPNNFYSGAFSRREHLKVNSAGSYLRADYTLGNLTLTSLTAFEHLDKVHPEDTDATANKMLDITFHVRSNTFTQELRAAQSMEKYNWVAGLYYLHEDLHQNQPLGVFLDFDQYGGFGIPAGPGAGDGIAQMAYDQSHQVTDAYAAYGQGDYFLTSALKLTLGARMTYESRSFSYDGSYQNQVGGEGVFGPVVPVISATERLNNSNFSWRTGLDYHFTSDVHAYVNVATGFKSGDFNGGFLSTVPAQTLLQLQPVAPEKVTSYEVGIKSALFGNHLVANLAAFYNRYDDMQVFVLVPSGPQGNDTPVNVLANARKAHTEGLDAEIIARPVAALTATFNVGLLRTRIDSFVANVDPTQPNYSGNELPFAPHVSFSGVLNYRLPVGSGNVDLQVSASYKAFQFFDITEDPYITQAGYWLENVRAAYSLSGGHWELAAFVRNLSNKQYYVDKFDLTSPWGYIQGVTGVPRSFGGEVNYRF